MKNVKANPVRKREKARVLEPIRTFLGISQKKNLWNIFRKFYIVLLEVEGDALHHAKC